MLHHNFSTSDGMVIGTVYAGETDALGRLIITTGNNVTLVEGSFRNYTSMQIDAGGSLTIAGASGAITEICCQNRSFINGNIYCNSVGTIGTSGSKTTQNNITQEAISFSQAQRLGGDGHNGHSNGEDNGPGAAGSGDSNGNGGGGGGGVSGWHNSAAPGGESGGGGATYGNGGNGTNDWNQGYGIGAPNAGGYGHHDNGGGGGGAFRGRHGGGLYLICRKEFLGTGTIFCGAGASINGSRYGGANGDPMTGYIGGNGYYRGGGGGGGAGGNGGKLWIRATHITPTYSVAGGTGGAGGADGGAGTWSAGANPANNNAGGCGDHNPGAAGIGGSTGTFLSGKPTGALA